MVTEHSKKLPIFWGHGEEDPLITLQLAKESKEFLNSKLSISDASEPGSVGLSFNTYKNMGHSAEVQELEDLKRWLRKVVPKLY
jgi:predicted esterase